MAEVGTYYITIMPEMSRFTGSVTKALGAAGVTSGEKYNGGFLQTVKNSAIGVALGTLAVRAGDALVSGISTGIDRADTLKNFPRVMEAMGYSADTATESINKIMERMRGLPASTQDVVRLTQAIADSTGDLELATNGAIAFTDAMIANGSSAAEVTQAQGVLNRILGKGNATAAQWNSLMSVMPIQLNAVAREMLGAGGTSEMLREKLNDGTISWNDFLNAMVKLDNEGSGAMKSFREQAIANSDGIGVAIANLQWRIGTGWANIINAIGRENISGLIGNISAAFEGGMGAIANAIGYLHDRIAETKIGENLGKLGEIIGGFFKDLFADEGSIQLLKDMTDTLVRLINDVLQWLVDHGDAVKVVLGAIVGAITALLGFDIATKLAALPGLITAITTALTANPIIAITAAVAALVLALYTFFTQTEQGKAIVAGFMQFIDNLGRDFQNFCDICKREAESFKAFIDGIPNWWEGVKSFWAGALDEQAQNFSKSWEKIKGDFGQAWADMDATLNQKTAEASAAISQWTQDASNAIGNAWASIKSGTQNAWNAVHASVTTAVSNMASRAVSGIVNFATRVSTVFGNVKNTIQTIIGAITSAFEALSSTIQSITSGIASAINSVADAMHNLFSIKMPSLSGFKLPSIGLPSYSPRWYAEGGVFKHAQIIGIGEHGKEAALPLNDSTYSEIAKGISKHGDAGAAPTVITGNNFYVREELDIERVSDSLNRKIERERRARRK